METADFIPLSALQHYIFCPRQCALIYSEREWRENALTTMGKIEHERVDSGHSSNSGTVHTARTLRLICHRLGIQGVADAVEYHYASGEGGQGQGELEELYPIEYKHGAPKEDMRGDEVQLCAQALCLEEMHGITIEAAYIFYHRTRRRLAVPLDAALRELTQQCIEQVRALLSGPGPPIAYKESKCRACSLEPLCLPLVKKRSAAEYNQLAFQQLLEDAGDT